LEKKNRHGLLDTVSNDSRHAICAEHPDVSCLSAIFAISAVNNPGYAQLTRFISPEVKALFEQKLPPGVAQRDTPDPSAFPRRIDSVEDVRKQLGDLFNG
jgi:hypothetical protein